MSDENNSINDTAEVPKVEPKLTDDIDSTRVMPVINRSSDNNTASDSENKTAEPEEKADEVIPDVPEVPAENTPPATNVYIPEKITDEVPPDLLEDAMRMNEQATPVAPNQPHSHSKVWIPVLICSIVCVVSCIAILASYIAPLITKGGISGVTGILAPIVGEPPENTNVLIVGTDIGGYRTDTMMVASYDHTTDSIHVVQIPRDTYVGNNGRRDKKINSAYFNGIDTLKDEIYLAFGIEIDRYLSVQLDGFVEMVDAIGGVEVDVPINMDYDDPVQDLHIHIKKGIQVLKGKDAEGFVRYRKGNDGSSYPMGDLDRLKAQQKFLMSTISKVVSIDGINRIPELLSIAQDNIQTDISTSEATSYAAKLLSIDRSRIYFHEMPGEPVYKYGGWYFFVDKTDTKNLITQFFNAGTATPSSSKISNIYTADDDDDTGTTDRNYSQSSYQSSADIADDERDTYYAPKKNTENSATDAPDIETTDKPSSSASPSPKPSATAEPDSSMPTASPEQTKKPSTPDPSIAPEIEE